MCSVKKMAFLLVMTTLLSWPLLSVAESGEEPCHHNLKEGGEHHGNSADHKHLGEEPCDSEKKAAHAGEEPCDSEKKAAHAGDEPCDSAKKAAHAGKEPCDSEKKSNYHNDVKSDSSKHPQTI